jgi:hypothetical protein
LLDVDQLADFEGVGGVDDIEIVLVGQEDVVVERAHGTALD